MSTLIVPCAGESSRYPDGKPKWLYTHPNGKLIIQMSVENLIDKLKIKTIIFTINKKTEKKYFATKILKKIFDKKYNLNFFILNKQTKSASETIALTIKKLNVKDYFFVKDSDGFIDFYKSKKFKSCMIAGVDVKKITEPRFLGNKSFVQINKKNHIVDIVEKEIISNIFCAGLYGFNSASLFLKYYKRCLNLNKTLKGEIYISHVASQMIYDNEIFQLQKIDNYEDYGTYQDFLDVRKNLRTFFVDIDGVVFYNKGEYSNPSWKDKDIPIIKNLKSLLALQNEGNKLIFCTSRKQKYLGKTIKSLKSHGFKQVQVINNLFHSERIIINDYAESNPFPSCTSINIPRNDENLNTILENLKK